MPQTRISATNSEKSKGYTSTPTINTSPVANTLTLKHSSLVYAFFEGSMTTCTVPVRATPRTALSPMAKEKALPKDPGTSPARVSRGAGTN